MPRGRAVSGVRLIHDAGGDRRTLATTVDVADSLFSQARGLMFRRSIPDDYALVFRFSSAKKRDIHMLFVPFPLDVLWLDGDTVAHVARLKPWRGFARERGDRIIELPAGAAAEVAEGDTVRLVD